MSEAKTQRKDSATSKKTSPGKAEAGKNGANETSKTADTNPVEKTDAVAKSASQSSISHFSSVSTPAYKEGWDSIFGGSKITRKTASKTDNSGAFPEKLTIHDEDIDKELRGVLYKAFQQKARKQGVSLAKIKKLVEFEYVIDCHTKVK